MTTPPLHAYQDRAIAFCLARRFVYQMIDMGLGKTRISLEVVREVRVPTLVIAPLRAVKTTWPDEIEKWTPELTYQVLHGPSKKFTGISDLYIINFDGIQWLFEELKRMFKAKRPLPFKAMILDEGSMVKSHATKRFKSLKHIKDLCREFILILSGTPAPNSLLDLWSQYYLLDGGKRLGKDITTYRKTFFRQKPYSIFCWELQSPAHEVEIHKRVSDITFRLEAADYLTMPGRVDNIISVKLSAPVMQKIKTFEKELMLKLSEETTVTANFAASLSMKLRQVIQGGLYIDEKRNYEVIHTEKLEILKSLVEEANGQGILCAIQFRFELDMLLKAFPGTPAIVGGSKIEEFKAIVDAWNRGEVPLLICHPASLSHSVNLQMGSHLLVWYALPWSLEHYLQLNARIERQGQKHVCIFHHLVAKGTVDEKIMKALQMKLKGQNALLDYLKQTTGIGD